MEKKCYSCNHGMKCYGSLMVKCNVTGFERLPYETCSSWEEWEEPEWLWPQGSKYRKQKEVTT